MAGAVEVFQDGRSLGIVSMGSGPLPLAPADETVVPMLPLTSGNIFGGVMFDSIVIVSSEPFLV